MPHKTIMVIINYQYNYSTWLNSVTAKSLYPQEATTKKIKLNKKTNQQFSYLSINGDVGCGVRADNIGSLYGVFGW